MSLRWRDYFGLSERTQSNYMGPYSDRGRQKSQCHSDVIWYIFEHSLMFLRWKGDTSQEMHKEYRS